MPGKPDESLLWEKVEVGRDAAQGSADRATEKSRYCADGSLTGRNWGTDPIDPYQRHDRRDEPATTGGRSSRSAAPASRGPREAGTGIAIDAFRAAEA